jgi:hypothetical protein
MRLSPSSGGPLRPNFGANRCQRHGRGDFLPPSPSRQGRPDRFASARGGPISFKPLSSRIGAFLLGGRVISSGAITEGSGGSRGTPDPFHANAEFGGAADLPHRTCAELSPGSTSRPVVGWP